MFITFAQMGQAFIQTVLLMSVFEKQYWVFEGSKMYVGVAKCCELCNEFMEAPWWVFRGVKVLKHLSLFTTRGNINSLK